MLNPRRSFNYIADGHYWGFCQRCGFKTRNDHLKLEWTKLWVCDKTVNNCYEERNIQDFVRGVPDKQSVFPALSYDGSYPNIDSNYGFTHSVANIMICNATRCNTGFPS